LQFRDTPQRLGAALTSEGITTNGKILASNLEREGELWSQTEETFLRQSAGLAAATLIGAQTAAEDRQAASPAELLKRMS